MSPKAVRLLALALAIIICSLLGGLMAAVFVTVMDNR